MPLFALTILLSAFLLFLVQPIVAKQILPWFGGSAAVWTTCMVFFQSALLGGYAYADWLARRPMRRQAWLHGLLAAASLAVLPIVPAAGWRPDGDTEPIGRILLLLLATIGLPYFVLSATGPLLQAWFARTFPQRRVYRLYALSNIGSMSALIAYPLLVEPASTARAQSIGWSLGYGAFVLLVAASAWRASRPSAHAPTPTPGDPTHGPAAADVSSIDASDAGSHDRPRPAEQALWLLLAALGSMLLLAVTTHLTQNVASVPFLWVLPLSIYLLTFILCFDGRGWRRPTAGTAAAMVLGALMAAGLVWRLDPGLRPTEGLLPLAQAVPLYCVGLFGACMFCHGTLAARRPSPRHLTRFYLMVSVGGAIGGVLVGIVAPLTLPTYHEFPAAITLTVLTATLLAAGRALRLLGAAATLVCLIAFALQASQLSGDALLMQRDFYGTLRVRATGAQDRDGRMYRLMHGVILHGEQFRAERLRRLPTTYYGEGSGVGRAIAALRERRSGAQRVGLVGLGVGTLATYGRAGDTYRFYELDPQVLRVARSHFTYLADSRARVEMVLGDARLTLEREPPQRLDLLAVDAFSSDSIPVHLLTREAMQTYLRHLAPGAVIAIHVSNRYLDLAPVVRQLADEAGLRAVLVADRPDKDSYLMRSDWVLVTADAALADALIAGGGREAPRRAGLRAWTDDYNNLLQVLK